MLFGVAVVISPSVFIAVSCSVLWVYHNLSGSVIPPLLSSSRVSCPFAFPCFPGGSAGKESAHSGGELGSIPGLGRSSGEGKGYPLQYSDLENSMDCIVHRVAKSWTQLSDFHFHFQILMSQNRNEITALVTETRMSYNWPMWINFNYTRNI